MIRCSSFREHSRNQALSSSQLPTFGTGTMWFRRKYPPSPSTPAFSWPSRRTELGLKTPMRSEGDESRRLLSPVPAQDPFHRTHEVVIAKLCTYAAKISEPQLVRFQKGRTRIGWSVLPEENGRGMGTRARSNFRKTGDWVRSALSRNLRGLVFSPTGYLSSLALQLRCLLAERSLYLPTAFSFALCW